MASKSDINPATGKAYAVNPSTGNWDDNYWANTVEPALKSANGGASGNYGDIAAQALELQRKANEPVVQSLQASLPEISAKYQTERTRLQDSQPSLEQRYDNLITEIKGNQVKEESRTNIANSQE
jgi:hypothetical protein